MTRPLLLDLFCGAGGAAMGYYRAGFDVVGVDIKPQPHYPFKFHQGDALNPPVDLSQFDVIHASPPCQCFTAMRRLGKNAGKDAVDLVEPTRSLLVSSKLPYVIENVVGAPLVSPIRLCGSSFDLDVQRHRLFESNCQLSGSKCAHTGKMPTPVWGDGRPSRQEVRRKLAIAVYGDHPQQHSGRSPRRAHTLQEGQRAMGIDWMPWKELTQAIPPAYTEYIGKQLINHLQKEDSTHA